MTAKNETATRDGATLTLRRATTDDIATIRRMADTAFPATYAEILSPEQLDYMMEWMYAPQNLARQMTDEGHVYFIACVADRPCGYVSVRQESADAFHLEKIYVLPDCQGRGVGGFLFRAAIDFVKRMHPSPCRLELNVNRHNRARGFYERMGMTCLREGDFPIGQGFFMNDYIMGMEI